MVSNTATISAAAALNTTGAPPPLRTRPASKDCLTPRASLIQVWIHGLLVRLLVVGVCIFPTVDRPFGSAETPSISPKSSTSNSKAFPVNIEDYQLTTPCFCFPWGLDSSLSLENSGLAFSAWLRRFRLGGWSLFERLVLGDQDWRASTSHHHHQHHPLCNFFTAHVPSAYKCLRPRTSFILSIASGPISRASSFRPDRTFQTCRMMVYCTFHTYVQAKFMYQPNHITCGMFQNLLFIRAICYYSCEKKKS